MRGQSFGGLLFSGQQFSESFFGGRGKKTKEQRKQSIITHPTSHHPISHPFFVSTTPFSHLSFFIPLNHPHLLLHHILPLYLFIPFLSLLFSFCSRSRSPLFSFHRTSLTSLLPPFTSPVLLVENRTGDGLEVWCHSLSSVLVFLLVFLPLVGLSSRHSWDRCPLWPLPSSSCRRSYEGGVLLCPNSIECHMRFR